MPTFGLSTALSLDGKAMISNKLPLNCWKRRTLTTWMNCANWLKGAFGKPTLHTSTKHSALFSGWVTSKVSLCYSLRHTPKEHLIREKGGQQKRNRQGVRAAKVSEHILDSLTDKNGMTHTIATTHYVPLWIYWPLHCHHIQVIHLPTLVAYCFLFWRSMNNALGGLINNKTLSCSRRS